MGQQAEKDKTEGNRARQKNKRGDSKVESHDSSEIPDRGETSDIHGLRSGSGGNVMHAVDGGDRVTYVQLTHLNILF